MSDDKTHARWTFAVVFVGRTLNQGNTIEQARRDHVRRVHYRHTMQALKAAVGCIPQMTGYARQIDDGFIRILAVPPGEAHDYDGEVVATLKYGCSAD